MVFVHAARASWRRALVAEFAVSSTLVQRNWYVIHLFHSFQHLLPCISYRSLLIFLILERLSTSTLSTVRTARIQRF